MKKGKFIGIIIVLLAGSAFAGAKEVREWNMAAIDMIKRDNISNHFGNRTAAILHIAMFDAVNGIEKQYNPYLVSLPASGDLPTQAAVAAAAFEVLSRLYPLLQEEFEPLYAAQLARVADGPNKQAAMLYGQEVADRVLQWRENDGSAQAGGVPYPDGTEPGQWRRTDANPPVLPGWGQVRPFAMTAGDQFRLTGPPDMTEYVYARDYSEVMEIGRKVSSSRTAEQTTIARFWPMGIPRMWNLVAHQAAEALDCSLLEEARLFALVNVALADAQVVGWDMKYHYGFWRPITAIRLADQDGNDATTADPAWESLLPAPAFPEYTSGHSTSCSAAATVLAKFAGTNSFTFTLNSEANPGLPTRTYTGFWQAAAEAGISRIYGGIHFNFSNTDGLEAGRSLGRYIYENFMAVNTDPCIDRPVSDLNDDCAVDMQDFLVMASEWLI